MKTMIKITTIMMDTYDQTQFNAALIILVLELGNPGLNKALIHTISVTLSVLLYFFFFNFLILESINSAKVPRSSSREEKHDSKYSQLIHCLRDSA